MNYAYFIKCYWIGLAWPTYIKLKSNIVKVVPLDSHAMMEDNFKRFSLFSWNPMKSFRQNSPKAFECFNFNRNGVFCNFCIVRSEES
jgi:hypothetical protein